MGLGWDVMESESIPMIGEKKLVDTPITFMPCMMVPNCSENPNKKMVKPPFSLVGIIALVAIFTQQENIRNR
jgi:hypothetical protein